MADFPTVTVSYNETRADGNFAWPVSYDLGMFGGVASLLLKIKFVGAVPANLLATWENGIESIWNNKVFFADANRLYEIKIATDFVSTGSTKPSRITRARAGSTRLTSMNIRRDGPTVITTIPQLMNSAI